MFGWICSATIIVPTPSWWEVLINSQILGVLIGAIVGAFVAHLQQRTGRVEIRFVPDDKYGFNSSQKTIPDSFMVDVFNKRQTPIWIRDMYLVDGELRSPVFRVKNQTGVEADPIVIDGRQAQRLVLRRFNENSKGDLVFVVNDRKRIIRGYSIQ